MEFQIWTEGFLVTGMEGIAAKAKLIDTVEANTFQEACDKLCSPKEFQKHYGNYNKEKRTVWGCRLFDNHSDAAKSFG